MSWFPPYDIGSNASVLGHAIYGDNSPWWARKIFSLQRKLNSVWSWFFYRLVCKRHFVKLPIKPGWIDADMMIFYTAFEILGKFVEEELGTEVWSEWPSYRGYRLHSHDEKAIDLWIWYKEEKEKGFSFSYKDEEIYDAKFSELMKIRRTLWT